MTVGRQLVGLIGISCLTITGWSTPAYASGNSATASENNASVYFDAIRHNPPLLLAFLQEMPKGGDLHNHLPGAIYAESFIDFATADNFCVDRTTSVLIPPPCDRSCEKFASKPPISCAYEDHVLYNSLIDAWSMRNWNREEPGHDHFFATFDKFFPAIINHIGDSLAEAASRAASDHLQYLELMNTADGMQAALLGTKLGWDDDFGKQRDKLLAGGLKEVIAETRTQLDRDESKMHALLKCGTRQANPGCDVTVRFLYQVLRGLPREQVFAQIVLGFELAQADPRFVGLNLVMPEDWYVPMHDFELHMQMLDYLHRIYPKVHISLHAGELAMGLVPPEGLRFHIRDSIERGHAERIGHGVSIMSEHDPLGLMREMSNRKVLVEICLTSNDLILNTSGADHPLRTYLQEFVPVALASDDEGVSRSDMTHEYVRAAGTYALPYATLKRMARQSLEHSFLPGASLWEETHEFRRVSACAADTAGSEKLSQNCHKFLSASERAQAQWKLESEFVKFEQRF